MKKRTLLDLLSAINIIGEDMDVTVDGIDSIAVCPPVRITPKGLEDFKDALDAPLLENCGCVVSCPTEKQDEAAWDLLSSLAGYCSSKKFEEWFEGDDAEDVNANMSTSLHKPISKEMDECVNDFMGVISEVTYK